MDDEEQTNETDTEGEVANTDTENSRPVSLYEKTEAMVARQEAANKKAEEILTRQEKLYSNQRLAGTAGGHIPPKKVDPEQKKTNEAKEFFKGTALGEAIETANGQE